MLKRLYSSLKAVALLVALLCLGLMAQGGVFARELLSKLQGQDLGGLSEKLVPLGINAAVAVVFLGISYLFYKPAHTAVQKTLDATPATQRGKTLLLRSMQAGYWVFTIFVVASGGTGSALPSSVSPSSVRHWRFLCRVLQATSSAGFFCR
ncbi:MAG: hypothetical protein IPO31_16335 [Candidatus Obscuribacter sp.]|nr:hypothetical protein [Candidatus Obscuribacter sp.]